MDDKSEWELIEALSVKDALSFRDKEQDRVLITPSPTPKAPEQNTPEQNRETVVVESRELSGHDAPVMESTPKAPQTQEKPADHEPPAGRYQLRNRDKRPIENPNKEPIIKKKRK